MDIDFSDFIEWYLQDLGLNYTPTQRGDSLYFITQSPLIEDRTPSFQIFSNGFCESYNTTIDGDSRLSLKKVCKITGYLQEYIHFLCSENNIPTYKINQYKDMLISKNLNEHYNYKPYNKLRGMFNDIYISQKDILSIGEVKKVDFEKSFKRKKKKKKSTIVEVDISEKEKNQVANYIKNRGLDLIDRKLEPVKLKIKGFRSLALAIRHHDNCTKYRLLEGSLRYLTQGTYKRPLEVNKIDDDDVCYMVEGEIEAYTLNKIIDKNIYALHNTNKIGDLNGFEKYNKFVFLIDRNTKYKVEKGLINKVKSGLGKDKEVIVKCKTEDGKVDFNDLLINNKNKLKKRLDKLIKV